MLVAGYGTFITNAFSSLKEDLTATQWYWNVKVLGRHRLKGWKRTMPKGFRYAIIVPDENSHVDLLVVKTEEENLRSIDHVEGYPNLYNRIEIETQWGTAHLYVPSDSFKHDFFPGYLDISEDKWQERIDMLVCPLARELFPEFFSDSVKRNGKTNKQTQNIKIEV